MREREALDSRLQCVGGREDDRVTIFLSALNLAEPGVGGRGGGEEKTYRELQEQLEVQ